jgi:DNA excision repair protein ERCC-2
MFSAQIDKKTVLDLRRKLKGGSKPLASALGSVNTALLNIGKEIRVAGTTSLCESRPVAGLQSRIFRLQTELRAWLETKSSGPLRRELIQLLIDANVFLDVLDRFDDDYVAISELSGDSVRYRLFCIDPARRMAEALKRCSSAVLFSATLVPFGYFRDVLGLDAAALEVALPYPFARENLGVVICEGVSTLYRRREATKTGIAQALADLVRARTGNYIAYFPSYAYLAMVRQQFSAVAPEIRVIIQTSDLTDEGRRHFLEQFESNSENTLVAFALMGGVFGEAIDLPGDRLIGAAIVGVGLPGLSPEREIIKRYYDEKDGRGFEYAFMYPGMNRVLQAAGRVVRTETDRGLVLLLDERFLLHTYRMLLPREWNIVTVRGKRQLDERITAFWAAAKG